MRFASLCFIALLAFPWSTRAESSPSEGGLARPGERDFHLNRRYLNFPIQNRAPKRRVRLLIDGRLEQPLVMSLAEGKPDWWAFLDTSAWQGRNLTVVVDPLAAGSPALAQLELSDQIKDGGDLYHEKLRPQFHFSARRGWINDPNGLVFYRGRYHLFYQHNPYGVGDEVADKHWGHAVSTDLVQWHELAETLAPDARGAIYSGSAVVDWANSSGLGTATQPPLVMFYTTGEHFAEQCLAFSRDGRSYAKYSGNPVVPTIMLGNRDPKVSWYAPEKKWVMCLYVGPTKGIPDARGRPVVSPAHTVQFLSSTDLEHWTRLGSTSGFFECPNLFALAVDGNPARRKWILTDASSDYMVGEFNGMRFVPETPKLQGHSGQHVNFYAAQVFSDIPATDGRCIQVGWLNAPSPGMPFNQTLSMPMELRLQGTPAGPRLAWRPVREMVNLRAESRRLGPRRFAPESVNPFAGFAGELLEVRADFTPGAAERISFNVRGIPVVYDARRQEIIVNHHATAAPLIQGRQDLAIYIDRTTLEVFASGGLTYVPVPIIADPQNRTVGLWIEGGAADFSALEVHRLRPIW